MEKILSCPGCGSSDFVKNGHLASGAQNHKCKSCGRQFVAEPKQKLIETHTREQIQIALRRGTCYRAICEMYDVSMSWLLWFSESLGKYTNEQKDIVIPENAMEIEFELDEMWSFVGKKSNKIWIWIAWCVQTRQVVAFHVGNRDEASCRAFWEKLPDWCKKKSKFYTDLWKAYQNVIPKDQHEPQEKRGKTNHVERFNGTLRAYCSRLKRKAYSFSKSFKGLVCHLKWIIGYFNSQKKLSLID